MDMTVDQKAAHLLADALDLLNSGGRHWIKHFYTRRTVENEVGYCAIGALRKAAYGTPNALPIRHSPEYLQARTALAAIVGDRITSWNDDDSRTWDDVRIAFQQAIKFLKK